MQFFSTLPYIVVGVIFTMAGDVFLKKSHMSDYRYLTLGLILYTCGVIPVAIVFKKIDFGSVFLIWEALTVILALVIANLYFKEPFTTYKGLALLFAAAALYFSYK
jgi:multidrug transporter EmrE-like cation transporter